ncbi:MAG TPA: hypothetical protein DCW71_07815 [Alistipes sp.]|nr:hypothetical protein [Alistipes sp.]
MGRAQSEREFGFCRGAKRKKRIRRFRRAERESRICSKLAAATDRRLRKKEKIPFHSIWKQVKIGSME